MQPKIKAKKHYRRFPVLADKHLFSTGNKALLLSPFKDRNSLSKLSISAWPLSGSATEKLHSRWLLSSINLSKVVSSSIPLQEILKSSELIRLVLLTSNVLEQEATKITIQIKILLTYWILALFVRLQKLHATLTDLKM